MPGTIAGAFIVDYLGPKYTMVWFIDVPLSCFSDRMHNQILGLMLQAVVGFIMSGLYSQLVNNIGAFAVVYGLFLSFGEVGESIFRVSVFF